MVKGEVAETLTGVWRIGLCEAPCKAPGSCCYACWCPCCMVRSQRKEILEITGEKYICCGGLYADCCCASCCTVLKTQQESPDPCLCLESFCCTSLGIVGNRYMIQTRFDRANTGWDDCMIMMLCV